MYQTSNRADQIVFQDTLENIELQIPAKDFLGLILPPELSVVTREADFERLILEPISGLGLSELAVQREAKSACVLISDATRQVPTSLVARTIVHELNQGGVALSEIIFIVAIGVHRDATEAEMRQFVGEDLYSQVRVVNHEPDNPANLIELGTTTFGTAVLVNKLAYQCDLHISIGKVEPHEFAGFSGGRKSVLPGVASRLTISQNHAPAMICSDTAVPGSLTGNLIHEDMVEAADLFRIDFTVQFVVDGSGAVLAGFAGPLTATHQTAIEFYLQNCRIRVPKPDILVTTPGYPLNIDFYQSMKPLIALTELADPDMTIVMYCECPEGVNSEDMLLPFQLNPDVEAAVQYACDNYTIQMDHSILISKLLSKSVPVVVWSPNVAAADIQSMHMIPSPDTQSLLAVAAQACGKPSPKVLIVPQAQRLLLELTD
jgi:nickel-dependent lactate racemase